MKHQKLIKDSVVFYSDDELRDPVCYICGEEKPERMFREFHICSRCVNEICKSE